MLEPKGWQIKAFLFLEGNFMRLTLNVLFLLLVFVFAAQGQERVSMQSLLLPSATDLADAKKQGLEIFKILPRGMFGYERNELALRGGGAYYSFVKKSHSYNEIPQLQLEQNYLSVGFYGRNYGLIADLGQEVSLSDLNRESKETDFLLNYQPIKYESVVATEYEKIGRGFEYGGVNYKKHLPAVVGHSYLLRAISYEQADSLVAFQIRRQEADGSLVIVWKTIEQFEKPVLLFQTDADLTAKLEKIRENQIFKNVEFEVKDNFVFLRGSVPRGKLNELLKLVNAERIRGMQIAVKQ
jgi:hypothetical protein